MLTHNQEIEKMKTSMMRMLKNTSQENQVLDREIERMHKIDRVKVAHAKTSIFVPEMGGVFPSLDVFNASVMARSMAPNMNDVTPDIIRNVVTSNELSGICERFGGGRNYTGQPSQR